VHGYGVNSDKEGWARYMAVERHALQLRANGLLLWIFSKPVPGAQESIEDLRQMAEEDQRLAQEDLVPLLEENYETSYKQIDGLTPEDAPARLGAELNQLEFCRQRRRQHSDASSQRLPTPPWYPVH
jgi:hypothetical protein